MKQETKEILNVSIGAIFKDNKLLLIRRKKEPFIGFWGLAGGKIKFGEDFETAILRELEEETGLKVKFTALRGLVEEFINLDGKTKAHFLLFVSETTSENKVVKEGEEGDLRWFSWKEILESEKIIIPSDYAMLKEFFGPQRKKLTIHKSHLVEDGKSYKLEFFGS